MNSKLINGMLISYEIKEKRVIESNSDIGTISIKKEIFITNVVTNEQDIFFPDSIDGMVITEFQEGLFENNQNIRCIHLPNHLEIIGEKAFYGCLQLKEILFPETLLLIGYFAFGKCESLESVDLSVQKVNLSGNTFQDCLKLKQVQLSNKIAYIGGNVFANTEFFNNKKNWENGALYCDTNLICVKSQKSDFQVKDGTKVIASYAFENNQNIKTVHLPMSLETIGYRAFKNCQTLDSITGPVKTLNDTEYSIF